MSIHELARHYLAQGQTVRAAGLMIKLVETEPTPENLSNCWQTCICGKGYTIRREALHLRVVKAGLKRNLMMDGEALP